MRLLALVLACALLGATPAAAQITNTGIRNLDFGPVIIGIAKHIGPSDPVRSGQFRFTAPLTARVRLQFTLPTRLDGPANARLPISFNGTDGIATGTAANSVPVTFDPRTAQTFQIVTSTTIHVFIGGTVTPANNQRLGSYTGTITLTVTLL